MTQRVNVLLLITELNVGGAERVVEDIAAGLSHERYLPIVACLFDPGPVADDIRAAGVPVIDLAMRGKWDLRVLFRLRRLLRDQHIHILHSHLIHANLLASVVGRLSRVPVIITTRHNVHIGPVWREWLNRWLSGWGDSAIAISDEVRAAELARSGASPEDVVVIANGVSLARFPDIAPDIMAELRQEWDIEPGDLVMGTVARFHEQKGHSYLLSAMPAVLKERPHIKLLLVGDGPPRRKIQETAIKLGVDDSVIFTGVRRDIPEILRLLDIFVLPSLWEGLPISILEAMAAGLPVVATRVGGVPEVVLEGETGLLVPPADPDALADALVTLIADEDLRRRMGRAGRARVEEHFSIARMVRETEMLYEELLEAKGVLLDG